MERRANLRVIPLPRRPGEGERCAPADIGLLAFLLALNLVPIGGTLAGGRWGEGTVGFATLVSLLCARELARELWPRRRGARR